MFVLKSDINKIIDVNINIDPTKTKLPSKKFDIFSSKRKPTIPAGIIEIIMSFKKCEFSSFFKLQNIPLLRILNAYFYLLLKQQEKKLGVLLLHFDFPCSLLRMTKFQPS